MKDLSVIIVNWNTREITKNCLQSLFEQTKDIDFEVWVVDNGSTDGSVEMVEKEFPQVKLIKNSDNLGFAKANNQALRQAQSKFILLLNSDTIILNNALAKMVAFMEKNSTVGISSCQLLNEDKTIQASGGYFPTLFRVFAWMFFLDDLPFLGRLVKPFHPHEPTFYTKDPTFKSQHFQDWVTGAFFLIRQEVVKEIGLLDENFFMYAEEMEYCFRAKQKGWRVIYTPRAQIVHLGRKSSVIGSKGAILGEYKGLSYFYQKHRSPLARQILKLLLKAGAMLRILVFGIILGKEEAKTFYAEAFRLA